MTLTIDYKYHILIIDSGYALRSGKITVIPTPALLLYHKSAPGNQ